MKKPFGFFFSLLFLYLIYGLFLSRFELEIIPQKLSGHHPMGYYDYRGAINVHTLLSSGSGDFTDVLEAAYEVGLDFIFFTDLNHFNKPKYFEGYHDKLLVFIDGEYSYLDSRLLNLGVTVDDHLIGPGRSQAHFADLLSKQERDSKKGIFILAHPNKPGFKWEGEYPEGLDGIEIINLKSIWQNAWIHDKLSFLWTVLVYPFNPNLAFIRLFGYPQEEIQLWDKLNKERHTIGIAGSDAEARLKFVSGTHLKIPSYQVLFSIVSNHILLRSELTGDADKDKSKVMNAVRRGQFYVSFDMLANPKGFLAVLREGNETHLMGSDINYSQGQVLTVRLPHKPLVNFETVIYKNGERMMSSNSQETRYNIQSPGNYRVMVRVIPTFPLPDGKKWIPWIFTNPFYVR